MQTDRVSAPISRQTDLPPARALGLIGGMSWHSTALYYARLNALGEAQGGEHANPASLIETLAFAPLLAAAKAGDWGFVERQLIDAARRLEQAGCRAVALTAVTAHRAHAAVAAALAIPVPHIFDAVAMQVAEFGAARVGVLATSQTLADPALLDRLAGGRSVLMLDAAGQDALDRLIFERLTAGQVDAAGQAVLGDAVRTLTDAGADLVVLACTELPLLRDIAAPAPTTDAPPIVDAVDAHLRSLLQVLDETA